MAAPAEEELGWSPGIDFPAIDLPPELPGESASVEFPDDPPSGVDFPPELLPPDPLPGSPPADTKPVKPAPVPVRPAPAASARPTATPARAPKKAPRPVVRKPAGDAQSDAPNKPVVKRETSERRPAPATKAPEAKSSGVKTPAAKPVAKASEIARASTATSGDSKPSSKSGEVQTPGKGSEAKPAVKRPPESPRSKAAPVSSSGASPAAKPPSTAKPPAPKKVAPKKVATAAEQPSPEAATTNAPAIAAAPHRPELRKAPRAELLLPMPAAPAANGAARTYPQPHAPIPLPEFDESALPENPDRARFDKLFDPEQAAILKLKEPTAKVIQADGEEIQLRKLTPEEKAARRLKYNIIFVTTTALILAIILIVSLNF